MFENVKLCEFFVFVDVKLVDILYKLSYFEMLGENIFGDDDVFVLFVLSSEVLEEEFVIEELVVQEVVFDGGIDDISEDEFEVFFDEFYGFSVFGVVFKVVLVFVVLMFLVGGDDIIDDEFEVLFDEFYGKG